MIATRKNDHRLMQVLLGPVISEKLKQPLKCCSRFKWNQFKL